MTREEGPAERVRRSGGSFLQDIRVALRMLWKAPGFTAVAILALALGIGANAAMFSIVHATFLAPMPYHDPDQLVMVWSRVQGNRAATAPATFLDWKRQSTVFQDLNAYLWDAVTLSISERPERVRAERGTPGYLTMFGLHIFLGRDFLPEEGQAGKGQVVILGHQFWRERFGGDRSIVGRSLRIDGKAYTVVGILAPGAADRVQVKLRLPLAFTPEQLSRDFHWVNVMGRLKPDVSLRQANADMAAVAKRLAQEYPASNKGWDVAVEPLQNNFLPRETAAALWLLMGGVGFVLLIACANVANLLLARGTVRQRELAIRASVGASRSRLFGQVLVESLILAVIGGTLGVALAALLVRAILAMMPPFTLASEVDVRLNVPVLLFTLAASVLSGAMAGCVPAWQATRVDVNDLLKADGGPSVSRGRRRLRRALVVTEVALALTLLAGGGLAIHSLVKLVRLDLGFRRDHLLTFSLPVGFQRFLTQEQVAPFYRDLVERIETLPGVVAVSASTGMPVQGTGMGVPFEVMGRPVNPGLRLGAAFNVVTPQYFHTFGIPMKQGRAFDDQDAATSTRVAIVNEAFVKRFLAGLDPLTQRLVIEQIAPAPHPGQAPEWQIVGVYQGAKAEGPRGDFPEIDVPLWQLPWPVSAMAVRTTGEPMSVTNEVASVVASMDPDLPMADVKTMDQLVGESLATDRFAAFVFGTFAAFALVLAALGIYGVTSFEVAQRTHEIGLRMALGAGRRHVLTEVLKDGLRSAVVGVAVGSGGAYLVGKTMQGLVFGVGAMDPLAFGVVICVLLAAATLACLIPAWRAAVVDPMVALRQG